MAGINGQKDTGDYTENKEHSSTGRSSPLAATYVLESGWKSQETLIAFCLQREPKISV